jgi:hypothetical protein
MTTLTVTEFNSLPEAVIEGQLEEHLAQDLTLGGALPAEQARELFRAGVTPLELERLPEREQFATPLRFNEVPLDVPSPPAKKRPRKAKAP